MTDLEKTLDALDRCLLNVPEFELSTVFDASFLAQMPLAQLESLLHHMYEQIGACRRHEITAMLSSHSARVRWYFERGYHVDGVAGVSEDEPHRIVFLTFGLPSRDQDSWEEIENAVRELPGQMSFEVRDLTSGRRLSSVEPDVVLGSGSTSKLLLFSCLVDQILSGKRRWDELVTLEERHISAPSGVMQTWPCGSPITLHTVAVLLISMSDNTAADLLLDLLGAEAVEATMSGIGVGHHHLSRPFLSTRALFRLAISPPSVRQRYRAAALEERRRILDQLTKERPRVGDQTSEPWPEDVDWYFSAAEVCTVLAYLHGRLASAPIAKSILGMSPGGIASSQWRFVGYKGGSSPGRVSLAALLEDGSDRRYAATLLFNTIPSKFSLERCATLMKRATDLTFRGEGGP